MSRSLGVLTLDLIAKTGGFEEGMTRAERIAKAKSDAIADNARKMGAAIGAVFGGIGAGAVFTRFIDNTRNAEREQAQLTAVLRSTGEAAGFTRDQLNAMADDLAGKSIFSGGEITEAQTALLAFTGIVGEQFPQALQAADMASRTGMTILSAAETIGRALDVPSQGMAALSRQGFRFTEDQKLIVKQLEETGRAAEAQAMILDALNGTYDKAAITARQAFGGALIGLRNTLDDLLTGGQGSLNAATEAINELSDALASPEARTALLALADGAKVVALVVGARMVGATTAAAASFFAAQAAATKFIPALVLVANMSATAAVRMTAAAAAARAMSASMALLGGPVGVAALAGAGLFVLGSRLRDTSAGMAGVIKRMDELRRGSEDSILEQLRQDIVTTEKEVGELGESVRRLYTPQAAAMPDSIYNKALKKLEEYRGRLAELRADEKAMVDLRRVVAGTASGADDAERAAAIRAAAEEQKRLSREREQEAASLQRSYDSISDRLREQIQLYGEVTNVSRIAYDTQYGDLIRLGEAQKKQLLGQAGVLDAIIQQQEMLDFMSEKASQLDDLRSHYAQENEVIYQAMQQRQAIFDEAFAAGRVLQDEYQVLSSQSANEYAAGMVQIEAAKAQMVAGIQQNMLSATGEVAGNLTELLRATGNEQTALGKAAFALSKGIAVASAVINANMAATSTMAAYANLAAISGPAAPVVLGKGMVQAEIIRAMGYVNAGLIAATAVASFDGGGFTGYGPRAGGLDGKGGFMAMLHPNESVLDHTKGQRLGGDVQVVVNNAPEGTQVRSRIEDGRRIVEVMLADIHSDGPVSRGLSGRFGLQRQGR